MQVEALLLRSNTDDSSKEHAMMKPISSQGNIVWLALMGTTMKDVFCRLVAVILSVAVAVAVAFAGGAADVAAAAAAARFYVCASPPELPAARCDGHTWECYITN